MSEKVHSQSALLTPKNLFEAMQDSDSEIRENQEENIIGAEDDNRAENDPEGSHSEIAAEYITPVY